MSLRAPTAARPTLSLSGRIVLLVTLFAVLLVGFDLWHSVTARQAQLDDDRRETANLARSLARQTHDLLHAADSLLLEARVRLEAGGASPPLAEPADWPLRTRLADLTALSDLFVVQPGGAWFPPGAHPDIDTLEAILDFHRGDPNRAMHIADPTRLGPNGGWVLVLSCRIDAPDGSFAGIVLMTLSIADLETFFGKFHAGQDGIISLILPDGITAIRKSEHGAMIGMDVSRGEIFQNFLPLAEASSHEYQSAPDRISRIGSFRRIDDYGLVIVVAHGLDEALATWRAESRLHLLVSAGAVALLAVLGALLNRHIRRGQDVEANYRLLAEYSGDVIVCTDLDLRRTYISPSITAVTGWSVAESLAHPASYFIPPEDLPMVQCLLDRLQSGSQHETATFRYRKKDGSLIWMEARYEPIATVRGAKARVVGNLRDITARKLAEDQLAALNRELSQLASTDGLTGLANRRQLDERLEQELRRALREDGDLAVLLIDVDRFKAFNDTYGHQKGDCCLRAVAGAVSELVRRPADLAARYGGEEIAVLLPNTDLAGAGEVAEQMRAAIMALAWQHAGNFPFGVVTVSIGAAALRSGTGSESVEGLIAGADAALYEAKRGGRNRVCDGTDLPVASTASLPPDEDERLAAVARYLDAERDGCDPCLDQVARLTASLFDMPTALISLIGADEQIYLGRPNTQFVSRDDAFCSHTILGDGVFVVQDTKADPRFRENRFVLGDPHIRFYAGAPLISPPDGQRVGSLCLVDSKPRPPLDPAQKALLAGLASLVVSHLEHGRMATQTAE